jgi:hypothetical protein
MRRFAAAAPPQVADPSHPDVQARVNPESTIYSPVTTGMRPASAAAPSAS